jgi:hypothetical protein
MDMGVILSMPKLEDLDMKFVLGQLHEHAEDIAKQVLARIEDRTPVDTGALKEDETYELANGGPAKATPIVTWYVGSEYQEAEWSREYAAYQEGPPLGESTYTNGPHQMFFSVSTDDMPLIETWAMAVVGEAVEQCVQAAIADTTQGAF